MSEIWDQLTNTVLEAVILAIKSYAEEYYGLEYKPRNQTKFYGKEWLQNLLDQGHSARIQDILRMDCATFLKLSKWLQNHGELTNPRFVCADQKLAIFLVVSGQGLSQRGAMKFFQHSLETISRCFNEVLTSLLHLHKAYVVFPLASDAVPSRIANCSKYYPYFKDCIGALDGIHIDIFVSGEPAAPYRNRRGKLSQNVLAVCSFDLQFTYVLAGWEGSAHDARVLKDAVAHHGLKVPQGKYLLADAGCSNTEYTMVPFRGT